MIQRGTAYPEAEVEAEAVAEAAPIRGALVLAAAAAAAVATVGVPGMHYTIWAKFAVIPCIL